MQDCTVLKLPIFDIKEVSVYERSVTFYFSDGSASKFNTKSGFIQKKLNETDKFGAKIKISSDKDRKMLRIAEDMVKDIGMISSVCLYDNLESPDISIYK